MLVNHPSLSHGSQWAPRYLLLGSFSMIPKMSGCPSCFYIALGKTGGSQEHSSPRCRLRLLRKKWAIERGLEFLRNFCHWVYLPENSLRTFQTNTASQVWSMPTTLRIRAATEGSCTRGHQAKGSKPLRKPGKIPYPAWPISLRLHLR
jgi:hypothetical protein